MKLSIVALLLLAACVAADTNVADLEEKENLSPFPIFHPRLPPWLRPRTTTKKPTTTTAEPTTTTEEQTTTKHHKTTTKPHKTTTTTAKPTTKPHKTTTTTTTELPLYRGDYERLENFGYYKIYNEHSNYRKAWSTCFGEGSHLLILRSQAEYDALRAWKPNYEVPGYSFYGVHHRFDSQNFVTLFDEPLSDSGYNKWSRDFTSNRTLYNNEDYPDMIVCLHPAQGIKEGLMLVYKQSSYFFICKMDI